jgi:hypothetical protein
MKYCIAALTSLRPSNSIHGKILDCLGLPSRPPPIAGAVPEEFDFVWTTDHCAAGVCVAGDFLIPSREAQGWLVPTAYGAYSSGGLKGELQLELERPFLLVEIPVVQEIGRVLLADSRTSQEDF